MAFALRAKERNYRHLIHVLGPDAAQRGMQSKYSVKDQMNKAHVLFSEGRKRYAPLQTRIVSMKILERIEVLQMLIDPTRPRFFVDEAQKGLIERLMNYKWAQSAQGGNKPVPLHDWASHGADSVGYGAWYFHRSERVVGAKPRGA